MAFSIPLLFFFYALNLSFQILSYLVSTNALNHSHFKVIINRGKVVALPPPYRLIIFFLIVKTMLYQKIQSQSNSPLSGSAI